MASAYSDDLRQKFFEAYRRGDGSQAVLAARFGVSRCWAEKLVRTVRQTGSTERPTGRKRGPASKLTPELREILRGWIECQPDLKLAELKQRLWTEHDVKISLSRLWTVLDEVGLRPRKNHSTRSNRRSRKSTCRTGVRKQASST
jgi:transposase